MNFKEMKLTKDYWSAKQIRGVSKKNLQRLYKKGLTIKQIALEFDISYMTIYKRLRMYGIKRK